MHTYLLPDANSLAFLTLGATSGVTKMSFPSLAASFSETIYIPGGFKFGRNIHTTVYVRRQDSTIY